MLVRPIKTHALSPHHPTELTSLISQYIDAIEERSVLMITSKVVSICEGSYVPMNTGDKDKLIQAAAQYFLPRAENPYHVALTITQGSLIASAGIDESNGDGYYILWPKDPFASARSIRAFLCAHYGLSDVGVIITDSKTTPLRWGTTGTSIAFAGLVGIKDCIGQPDLFGHAMRMTKMNIVDGLAAAAVVAMGETNESTPLCIINQVPWVDFDAAAPTQNDQAAFFISPEDDLYGPLLNSVKWNRGDQAR